VEKASDEGSNKRTKTGLTDGWCRSIKAVLPTSVFCAEIVISLGLDDGWDALRKRAGL
jgi:hypothetical protein